MGTLNIFRSICNPVRLCQNFGNSGGGVFEHTKPTPSPFDTPLRWVVFEESLSVRKDDSYLYVCLLIAHHSDIYNGGLGVPSGL